jgi:hypothetical protein
VNYHLYIHGVGIECSASEWEPVRLGEITRSLNGAPRSSFRVKKRSHRFSTDQGGYELEEAELLRALIEGEGHSWSFETSELYSSRRLLPSSVTAAVTSGEEAGKSGFGLFGEMGASVHWALGYTGLWTLLYWRLVSGNWVHYTVRRNSPSSLNVWTNDDLTDDDPGVVGVDSSGTLIFSCAEDEETIDDLVALPYAMPTAWFDNMYAYRQENPWGSLPYVKATGRAFLSERTDAGLSVLGQCNAGRRVPLTVAGVHTVGEVFDFSLDGV